MRLLVIVVLFLAGISGTMADSISLGTFVDAYNYESAYLFYQDRDWSFYLEHEPEYDYTLGILGYQNGPRQYILRAEDPDWIRLGLSQSKTTGDLSLRGQYLTGLGDPPHRLDLEASIKLDKSASLKVWTRIREGKKPDWFVGPQVNIGDLSIYYGHNLRSSGEKTIIANLEVITW